MLLAAACANKDYACELVNKLGLTGFWAKTAQFGLDRPMRILIVVVVAAVLSRVLARLARHTVEAMAGITPVRRTSERAEQRARTLATVTGSLVRIFVWVTAGLTILGLLGINLGPLIAGASILGVALGFGAQALVRDFLSGFFILVEDQYGVGDRINVGGTQGTVDDVTLRVTRMRADDGALWFVPNGEIRKVANTTMGWQRANVDIVLPLEADFDRAMSAMAQECDAMARDPAWGSDIVERPQVLGVDSMAADGLTIRLTVRTEPQRQDAFARAMRARILSRLKAEGIPIANPPAPASAEAGGAAGQGGG
ncbi:MAG: mechanosensitive ion channel family protein [Acidimicrobiia bacterium]|nr:mechanosensitive ion channel family protein [Acidimicrobiia bacterium]